jgi:hypothetical protein
VNVSALPAHSHSLGQSAPCKDASSSADSDRREGCGSLRQFRVARWFLSFCVTCCVCCCCCYLFWLSSLAPRSNAAHTEPAAALTAHRRGANSARGADGAPRAPYVGNKRITWRHANERCHAHGPMKHHANHLNRKTVMAPPANVKQQHRFRSSCMYANSRRTRSATACRFSLRLSIARCVQLAHVGTTLQTFLSMPHRQTKL